MSQKYHTLDELRERRSRLKDEITEIEKLITFDNPKESLSVLTHGATDSFLKEVHDDEGGSKITLNSAPILRGITHQIKNSINKNSVMQMVQSEPGSDMIQNALKLGAVTMVANYAQKNIKASSWKKRIIGLALIYAAPVVLKYTREKLIEYQKNKTASSLEKLI